MLCRASLPRHAAQSVPITFRRGMRKQDRLVKIQLTQDVPTVGAFGTVQEVKPGFMRNYLFPQGKANYITRERGPQLLRLPSIPRLSQATLSALAALPPLVFNRRIRTLHARNAPPVPGMTVHGRGITLADVKKMLATLGFDRLEPPQAVLEWADAPARKSGAERGRLKHLGEYAVRVRVLDGGDVVLPVRLEPQLKEEDVEEDATGTASAGGAPSTASDGAGAQLKVLPSAAAKVASINAGVPRAEAAVTAAR